MKMIFEKITLKFLEIWWGRHLLEGGIDPHVRTVSPHPISKNFQIIFSKSHFHDFKQSLNESIWSK